MTRLATPTFDYAHQKKIDQHLIFVNLYQYAKNQLFHLFILQIQSALESFPQTGHIHF